MDELRPKTRAKEAQTHVSKNAKINYARQLRHAMLRGYRKETR